MVLHYSSGKVPWRKAQNPTSMSGTYKAIGINLKTAPMGESDRLLTILTQEYGLVKAIAPGSRKHKSSLSGRSGLFVINNLLIVKGRSLDKVIQAESLESFPGLSQNLSKLTASQYLAELALSQALSDQPQADLFSLLREHLSRLEKFSATLPCLTHASFHFLALAGITPQVEKCCLTQKPIQPNFTHPDWRIGFSVIAGGIVQLAELEKQVIPKLKNNLLLTFKLTAPELSILQSLSQPDLIQNLQQDNADLIQPSHANPWLSIERILRHYAQYHLDRPIRSAALIDTCFVSVPAPSVSVNHDAIV
jgi:DNA repair protein RecO (recombination protein O)